MQICVSQPLYDFHVLNYFNSDLSKKCQCPDGFTGVHCEFEVKDTAPSDYCDALDPVTQLAGEPWSCKNNGTCLNGVT